VTELNEGVFMKIYISMLLVFFAGLMSVSATSVVETEGVTVTKQAVATAKKTVKVDWSTLKCSKYSVNGSANYFVKGLNKNWYRIKNKNWDCLGNAAKYKYDIKNCVCKVLYSSGGGGDDDDNDGCIKDKIGCDGATTAGTTGGDDGGVTTAGTTGGDDGGATTAGTTGGDDGGVTTAGTTGGDDGGVTTAGTTGGDDGGVTTAGTTTGDVIDN
jgi:hypothetical protein